MWIGNILLLILNIPLVGIWVRLLMVPYRLLYPAVVVLVCLGVYSLKSSSLDVTLVAFFSVFGVVLSRLHLEGAPLLLGFILAPLCELHFRRSLILSRGDLSIFMDRPISAGFIVVTAAVLLLLVVRTLRRPKPETSFPASTLE
jgi:TctA family transporter